MLVNGLDEILTATGMEPAHLRQQWSDDGLVEAHRENQQERYEPQQQAENGSGHVGFFSRPSLPARVRSNCGNESCNCLRVGCCDVRGTSTMSRPVGMSPRPRRKASR